MDNEPFTGDGKKPPRPRPTWGGEMRKGLLTLLMLVPYFAAYVAVGMYYGQWVGMAAGVAAYVAFAKLLDIYLQRRQSP